MKRESLKVTFVEFPSTTDGRLDGPPSHDVYSMFRFPSRACDLLAAIARRAGYLDTEALTPALGKGARLSEADRRRLAASDVVGISVITRTAPPSYEAARWIRGHNPRAKILFGGPHVSALPEEALAFCDVAVLREGDRTLVELLDRFREAPARPALSSVAGIAFCGEDGGVVRTAPRPLLTRAELDALPFPVLPEAVRRRITHQTIVTSRGCPHGCEFCSVIQNFGRGYRFLSVDRTVELIRHHLSMTRLPIFFADDNFTANPARVKRILERCLREGIRLPRWSCQSRVEAAFDGELLEIMIRAGLHAVMVGFESVNDETLALWRKGSTLEKNRAAVERFHAKGVIIHGMFVLGSDADTVETVRQTAAFAKAMNLDTAQFFALTPIPGPPLTKKLEAEGRVLTHDWHLYDAQHVLIRPRRMSAAELQDGIARAFREFYNPREALRRLFVHAPKRIRNSLIRLSGSRLVQRIVKETLPHRQELDRIREWLAAAEEILDHYRTRLAELRTGAERMGADLSGVLDRRMAEWGESRDRFIAGFEERLAALRERLVSLGESYRPFCMGVLEEVRRCVHSEAEGLLRPGDGVP